MRYDNILREYRVAAIAYLVEKNGPYCLFCKKRILYLDDAAVGFIKLIKKEDELTVSNTCIVHRRGCHRRWYCHTGNRGIHGEDTLRRLIFKHLSKRDGPNCQICKHKVSLSSSSFDHKIPVSLGGEHNLNNLRLTHRKCNHFRGERGSRC